MYSETLSSDYISNKRPACADASAGSQAGSNCLKSHYVLKAENHAFAVILSETKNLVVQSSGI